MSKFDEMNAALTQGQTLATAQVEAEQLQENEVQETAGTDKVSEVKLADQDSLTGASRSVSPEPEVSKPERIVNFAPIVASVVATVNEYELVMGEKASVNVDIIDREQSRLFYAIKALLTVEDNGEFMGGMEFLFRKFKEDKFGAFNGVLLRRRINYIKPLSSDAVFKSYNGILDMFQLLANPGGRRAVWQRYHGRTIAFDFLKATPEYRQRLETYLSRICA